MIAGMSAKASHAEGLGPEEWERSIAARLKQLTDREIVYRPKPNWRDARPIPGTRMVRGDDGDVHNHFANCHAVVTHHSNVAVDAVLAGVPAYCVDGVATLQSFPLEEIDRPTLKDEASRRQWANDLAYAQWSVAEMRSGACWRHLKEEGLV